MESILNFVEQQRNAYEARRIVIELSFQRANSDISPTRDSNGRYHAPVDGYMLPEGWTQYDDEHVFGAGEYLPIPRDDDDFFSTGRFSEFKYSVRVKATLDSIDTLAAEIAKHNVPATISHGRSWEQDGVQTAYAYVRAQWKGLLTLIADKLTEVSAKVVEPKPEVYLDGKHTVVGTVVSIKSQESYYGRVWKMLVLTEAGHKLYGSLPTSLSDAERGSKVSFTATFETGTQGMSWFKRPTKAVIVVGEE